MSHLISLGFCVGFGCAMSVGPIFLLIIRTNLVHGFRQSMMIGFGAVSADFTYLCLLSTGALLILNKPEILKVVGIVGALILFYFGFKTMRSKIKINKDTLIPIPKYHRNFITGYLICISSPLSIIFWVGIAGIVANIASQHGVGIYMFGISFFTGVMVFLLLLNWILLMLRHQINHRILQLFNYIGGLVIMIFGVYGLIKAFS